MASFFRWTLLSVDATDVESSEDGASSFRGWLSSVGISNARTGGRPSRMRCKIARRRRIAVAHSARSYRFSASLPSSHCPKRALSSFGKNNFLAHVAIQVLGTFLLNNFGKPNTPPTPRWSVLRHPRRRWSTIRRPPFRGEVRKQKRYLPVAVTCHQIGRKPIRQEALARGCPSNRWTPWVFPAERYTTNDVFSRPSTNTSTVSAKRSDACIISRGVGQNNLNPKFGPFEDAALSSLTTNSYGTVGALA